MSSLLCISFKSSLRCGYKLFVVFATAALLVGGCGDSNSNDGNEVPVNDYCNPVANWSEEWMEWEARMLKLMNDARASGAVCGTEEFGSAGSLEISPELRCAARAHSKDMAERDYFDHYSLEGEGPSERFQKAGWSGRGWGENIVAGGGSADGQFDMWMNSPGHCANIMNPSFTQVGIGYYTTTSTYGDYTTAGFGTP